MSENTGSLDLVTIDKSRFVAIKTHVSDMNEFVKSCMVDGLDFGNIPGVQNKVLLKQGAEKICQLLNVAPSFEIDTKQLTGDHREYIVRTMLTSRSTGMVVGGGVGSCSSLEKKYRYIRGVERPDPADVYNTVLKMAKKRSLVDAVITLGVCGGMFTQDVEEMDRDELQGNPAPTQVMPKQSTPAPTGQYVCNIPYKDQKAKDIAKANKWRWDPVAKVWSGSNLPAELKKYLVGEIEQEAQEDSTLWASGDDLPPHF